MSAEPGQPDIKKKTPAAAEPAQWPQAQLRDERRWSWLWLAPLVSVLVVAGIGYWSWLERGTLVEIRFDRGHGLKAGDVLRYRGVVVGDVKNVSVSPDLESVAVYVAVSRDADELARAGSRFWIVRPQLDVTGVSGLETLVGANYLAVLPGAGPRQFQFDGLPEPPVAEQVEAGGLEIVLQAATRGSMRPGAPINYRQFRIGTVLSVELAADASAVEARAYVRPDYRELVRENTVFWDSGGVQLSASWLSGVSLDLDSAESLVAGGVTMATPPEAGRPVKGGERFTLVDEEELDEQWADWKPSLEVGSRWLPPGADVPRPVRVTFKWTKEGTLWNRDQARHGWVLLLPDRILGPADLLTLPENALSDSGRLAIEGEDWPLSESAKEDADALAVVSHAHDKTSWPLEKVRSAKVPEDTLIITASAASARFVAAARYEEENGDWLLDPAISFDPTWHGATVMSMVDGAVVGVLVLDDESGPQVAVVPAEIE